MHQTPERFIIHLIAADAHYLKLGGHCPCTGQMEEGRYEFTPGKVAGGAKDHDDTGLGLGQFSRFKFNVGVEFDAGCHSLIPVEMLWIMRHMLTQTAYLPSATEVAKLSHEW